MTQAGDVFPMQASEQQRSKVIDLMRLQFQEEEFDSLTKAMGAKIDYGRLKFDVNLSNDPPSKVYLKKVKVPLPSHDPMDEYRRQFKSKITKMADALDVD